MNFKTASRTLLGSVMVSAVSFGVYLVTGQTGWRVLSEATGGASILCAGYILGRLDA